MMTKSLEIDLLQSFISLGERILKVRQKGIGGGAQEDDIAFDLLALVLEHYYRTYRPLVTGDDPVQAVLGEYPSGEGNPLDVLKERLLLHCDQERIAAPEKVVKALAQAQEGEYLTLLWHAMVGKGLISSPRREKGTDILLGLGFQEPYRPKWGFKYILERLEEAKEALLQIQEFETMDAEAVERVKDNVLLVYKAYKRLLGMLLVFYGNYAFDGVNDLVWTLKPEIKRPRAYLKKCSLEMYINLVSALEEYVKKRGEQEKFWADFGEIVLKRYVLNELSRLCEEMKQRFSLTTQATFTIEEVHSVSQYVIERMISHFQDFQGEYQQAFPPVIVMKTCTWNENGRVRIDYSFDDEKGIIRGDIEFQPRKEFYLYQKPDAEPVVIPLEEKHRRPIEEEPEDAELRKLRKKFEKCEKTLQRSGPQRGEFTQRLSPMTSPLEQLGIALDGDIADPEALARAIKHALQYGETDMIEFKSGPSKDETIVKEIAAFANTKGGILVFGLPDNPSNLDDCQKAASNRGRFEDPSAQRDLVERLHRIATGLAYPHRCVPPVKCAPHVLDGGEFIEEGGGKVILITVLPLPEGSDLCCAGNFGIYVRIPGQAVKADPNQLQEYYKTGRKLWMPFREE